MKGEVIMVAPELKELFIAIDARERCLKEWRAEEKENICLSLMEKNLFLDAFMLGWFSAKGEYK